MSLCIPQAEKLPAPEGWRRKRPPLYFSVMDTLQWVTSAPGFVTVPIDGSGWFRCTVVAFIDTGALQIVVEDEREGSSTEYRSSLMSGYQEKVTIEMAGMELAGWQVTIRILPSLDTLFYIDSVLFEGYEQKWGQR